MSKFVRSVIFSLLIVCCLCSCGQQESSVSEGAANQSTEHTKEWDLPKAETQSGVYLEGTYSVHVSGYDWGAGVDKATIHLNNEIDAVTKDAFLVLETKAGVDSTQDSTPMTAKTAERQILDAYLTDGEGNKTTDPSRTLVLELYVSPDEGSPIVYDLSAGLNKWCDPYYLKIEKREAVTLTSNGRSVSDIEINEKMEKMETEVDNISIDSFTSSDRITYQYAHYEPKSHSDLLIVWLHGGGEGGRANTDPRIAMLACKSAAFMSDEFQSAVGGANILIPQCPTLWMDMNGGGRVADILQISDGTSFYRESLKELIDTYREETDAQKVILAGCSNGGFMSLLLAISFPDQFAGVIPICETLRDDVIADEEISGIKDIPMYFIYAKDDSVAQPDTFSIPTIARLREAGASDLHIATFEHVFDQSGQYSDENGNPYPYPSHWSWIYFFNNAAVCSVHGESAWDFISRISGK